MSVTDEILELFSGLIVCIWLVALGFRIWDRTNKALHDSFETLTIAVILFSIIANFHLHHLVVVTMMSLYLVIFTSYIFFSKINKHK